jgi:hypothetical protein
MSRIKELKKEIRIWKKHEEKRNLTAWQSLLYGRELKGWEDCLKAVEKIVKGMDKFCRTNKKGEIVSQIKDKELIQKLEELK